MCNSYSLGRQGPDALRAFSQAERDETGNMTYCDRRTVVLATAVGTGTVEAK